MERIKFYKNYFRFQRVAKGNDRRVIDIGQFKGLIKTDSICGCCVMIRSKILRKTNKLHPQEKQFLMKIFSLAQKTWSYLNGLKSMGIY